MNPILAGVIASAISAVALAPRAIAGLATFIGALPVILPLGYIKRAQGAMLGFGGGVMLAATAFSLIIPGKDAAIAQGASQLGAATIIVFGVILGGAFLKLTHHFLPHEHFFHRQDGTKGANLRRIWLFIFAITMHNFPEGLAVGVNFGNGNFAQGIPLTIGIGLQNIPEGLVVALSLVGENYSILYALGVTLLTGLVEPIGGLIGAGIVSVAQSILPWAMSFAAGAMLFVISDDIIPESHQSGREQEGTIGIIAGFAVMTFLDIGLG